MYGRLVVSTLAVSFMFALVPDGKATYRLGLMYERGKGVAQDATQALQWFRQAADQGLAAAKKALRRLEKPQK